MYTYSWMQLFQLIDIFEYKENKNCSNVFFQSLVYTILRFLFFCALKKSDFVPFMLNKFTNAYVKISRLRYDYTWVLVRFVVCM